MFERFTKSARAVVLDAQSVYMEYGGTEIDTRHVLAALADQPGRVGDLLRQAGMSRQRIGEQLAGVGGGIDRAALASIGIDYDEVRRAVEESFGEGALERAAPSPGRRRHTPLGADSREALANALRSAVARREKEIRPEHLLVGVLTAKSSKAAQLLREAGVDPEQLRGQVT